MSTILIFLKTFYQNSEFILPVLALFFITSFVGYQFYVRFVKEDDQLIAFPAGVIAGVLSFILFLAVFSYLFKGKSGIIIILTLFIITGLFTFRNLPPAMALPKIKLSLSNMVRAFIYILFLTFFLFTAGNNIYGGDVIAYWAFATSFANGNYPLHSPWQPDLLAAHHQGAFLYQGAIQSITNANIKLIHSLFSFLIISSGFFLMWGWISKQSGRKFLSIVPAMVLYISFAAFFIPMPISFGQILHPEVNHQIDKLPIMSDFKNRLGGSSNLNELVYINHRALAFAGLMLVFIVACSPLKVNSRWKMFLLVLLIIPAISSDEVVFPAIGFGLLYWWINTLKKQSVNDRKKTVLFSLLAGFIFLLLFFVTGSALRDAMLIPSQTPRFQLITDFEIISKRFNELKGAVLSYERYGILLYLIDYRLIAIFTIFLGIKNKNNWANMMLFSSLGTLIAMLISEHTFYPGNHGRFLHLFYLTVAVAFSFNLILLLSKSTKVAKNVIALVLLILVITPISLSLIYLLKNAKSAEYSNLYGKNPDYKVLEWSKANSSDKRIFFLDGYLKGVPFSYLTLYGVQNFGLKVPVSPAFIKVHTPDFGVEALDVISSLDPKSINDLQIDYIFIAHDQVKTFPPQVVKDINNQRFFQLKYSDELGKMYSVSDLYKSKTDIDTPRVRDLKEIIPKGSKVFLDAPPQLEMNIRAVLLLALQNTGKIATFRSSGFFNYIETSLISEEPEKNTSYDFLFLAQKTDPYSVCNCSKVEAFWKIPSVVGYKVIE